MLVYIAGRSEEMGENNRNLRVHAGRKENPDAG